MNHQYIEKIMDLNHHLINIFKIIKCKMETLFSLWIIMLFLMLLLSLPRLAPCQLQRDAAGGMSISGLSVQNSNSKNNNNEDNDDVLVSMLFSNTFCKFIFNGPEDDDEKGSSSSSSDASKKDPVQERTIRSIISPSSIEGNTKITPSVSLSSSHLNRHHHHHQHNHNNKSTTDTSLINPTTRTISLNELGTMELSVFANQMPLISNNTRTRRQNIGQDFFSNSNSLSPPLVQAASEQVLHSDANYEIDGSGHQSMRPNPNRLTRRQKKSGKKNHYNHYSYSPPSDSHPVYIGLEIIDVDRINDAENYFSLQLYLFEMWHEPRLNTTALKRYWAQNSDPIPVLEANIADCLWTPSLVFEDSTEKEHLLPPTNILLAHYNKVLLRKSRYSLKVRCHMNLQIYPMDKHSCHFKLRAFTDPVHKVVLKWLSDPGSPKPDLLDREQNEVIFNPEFTPSLFDIRVRRPAGRSDHVWLNEKYSLLDVEFIFERRIIHSLLTVYIPSSLIVTLSWLQFWFDVEAVPGRMSLGIMSTLTIMTQILTNYEKAGNHVTAVDIWLFVCLIMVFLALMEYALAYTISHYYDDFDDDDDFVVRDHSKIASIDADAEKIKLQQQLNNIITTGNCFAANQNDSTPTRPVQHQTLFQPINSNNQVTPLKTSSLPTDTNLRDSINISEPYDKENQSNQVVLKTKDPTALPQDSPTVATISDRILLVQQQILLASRELELLLNEKFSETLGVIQSVRRMLETQRLQQTMLLAQSSKSIQMVVDSNNNKNENMYIHQRHPLKTLSSTTTGQQRPNSQNNNNSKSQPNRLTKFRQSLRRQMSSRNLKAVSGTGSKGDGGKNNAGEGGGRSKLSEVDYCSRYLFPFAFVLFAIGYWIALIYYKLMS